MPFQSKFRIFLTLNSLTKKTQEGEKRKHDVLSESGMSFRREGG